MLDEKTRQRLGAALDELTGDAKKLVSEQMTRLDTVEKDNAALRDRIEEIEAKRSTLPKDGGGKTLMPAGVKTYETRGGLVHELPSNIKVSDVLPNQKDPEISLERWLHATVAGERCEDPKALEFVREQKQLVTTTSGIMIPQEYQSRWIDLVRSQMVLNQAGMTTVTMASKKQVHSAVATDPAANWHTEAGSISADNPTFVERSLTAQTLVTRCQGSVELAQDSPDFGAQLAAVMTRAMAVELDRVGLVGSGSAPEPRGITNTTGRGQVNASGAVSNYSALLRGVRTLLENNVPLDVASANALMGPLTWYTYENLATGISSDNTQLPRPKSLENTAFRVTTNGLESDNSPQTGTVIMGDFRDLLFGVRREASIEILKLGDYAGKLVLDFVGFLRADYLVRRPSSFVTIEGMTVS